MRMERREVDLPGLAGRLEHRLHWPNISVDDVRRGCAFAVEEGLPVVLCRPDQVAVAAAATAGTEVVVGTALGVDLAPGRVPVLRAAESLVQEAHELVAAGATELGLIAEAGDMNGAGLDNFLASVAAVRDAVEPKGGRVRVLLNTTGVPLCDVSLACRQFAQAGVWLVQGGTFLGARASLTVIEAMRQALGPEVLLKWTNPIRSVASLLVCIAEGIDRFNGDPPALLAAARREASWGPLTVPLKGTDY
jgi:deoxyribose-phosphate aldolase